MRIVPYINLPGNAEEALEFYNGIFGGEAEITRWAEMPPDPKMPVSEAWKNKIMHATLTIREDVTIYLADSWVEGEGTTANNVFLHVEFDSEDALRNAFDALSADGKVNMPLDTTFWGAVYGDLVDKFGTGWGLHYQLPG